MSDYLTRFEALAAELAEIDYIEVPEFRPGPPAASPTLDAFEQRLGTSLVPGIRQFYEQANGLKLHWQIKPDVSPELAEELRERSKDYVVEIAEYIGTPFAIINILSIEDSVLKEVWTELTLGIEDEQTTFKGTEHKTAELAKLLKPFDILNREHCVAFFLEHGNSDPPVLLLSDGYTNWSDSRLTNFASYIEMLLATRGIVEARPRILGDAGGTEKPPLLGDAANWAKYVPDLFR
jgi:hypothetical protein